MSITKLKAKAPLHGFRIVARGESAEIYLYGLIGSSFFFEGIGAKQFADELKKIGAVKTINLRINSDGGDVFEAKTIHTLLVAHPARIITKVDGVAASAASFVAMAGDSIEIAQGAFMMIHEARMRLHGRATDLRRGADLVEAVNAEITAIYAGRTKNDVEKIKGWLSEEKWFSAKEALDAGFADTVTEPLKVAACVSNPKDYRNLPAALRPNRIAALSKLESLRPRVAN